MTPPVMLLSIYCQLYAVIRKKDSSVHYKTIYEGPSITMDALNYRLLVQEHMTSGQVVKFQTYNMNVPPQNNNYDCGIHLILNIEYFLKVRYP